TSRGSRCRRGKAAVGPRGFSDAGWTALLATGHADVGGRQRTLPQGDLRQLRCPTRHHVVRLRGLAGELRHRTQDRVPPSYRPPSGPPGARPDPVAVVETGTR